MRRVAVFIACCTLHCSASAPSTVLLSVEPPEASQQTETPVLAKGTFATKVKFDFQRPDASTREVHFRVQLEQGSVVMAIDRVTYLSSNELQFVVPRGLELGAWTIRVTDPLRRDATLIDGMTVVECSGSCVASDDGGLDGGVVKADAGTPDGGFVNDGGFVEEDAGITDAGAQRCTTPTLADDDGDQYGRAGTSAMLCGPGRTQTPGDCDDVDSLTHPNASEFCNRIDDDCDGQVDEGACPVANPNWVRRLDSPQDKEWWTAAAWARGRVWIAGRGEVWVRADGGLLQASSMSCPNDLRKSWVDSEGTLFLGSAYPNNGRLSDHQLGVPSCGSTRVASDQVAGLWGGDDAGVLGVFKRGGRFDWLPPSQPSEQPSTLGEPTLALEDAQQAGGNLIAVGSLGQEMVALWWEPSASRWLRDRLDRLGLPSGSLRAVAVLSSASAFAVGDEGVVLERVNRTWRRLPSPSGARLTSVLAFGPSRVYVTGSDGTVRRWNGRSWQLLYSAPFDGGVQLLGLTAFTESELWAVGSRGWVVHWPEE